MQEIGQESDPGTCFWCLGFVGWGGNGLESPVVRTVSWAYFSSFISPIATQSEFFYRS